MTSSAALNRVHDVIEYLRESGALAESTVILIGSAARDAQRPESDVDILVVSERPIAPRRFPFDVHLQIESRAEFLERLAEGDDFPQWALTFGKVMSDEPNWFSEARAHPAALVWPDWRRKLPVARVRLRLARDLQTIGDLDAAREELMFSASHVARAILLKRRVLPLSRRELADQLRESGSVELAEILDALTSEEHLSATRAQAYIGVITRLLDQLGSVAIPA